ncbi:MerR family transcriptional regulator [Paenibacillus sp. HJGM_3]|uniref:MerR family transcriptional regulator n=1 Tax=Paenibacillus sp. HJGM_3 TaxID=3379816 RepID=UPI00385A42A3
MPKETNWKVGELARRCGLTVRTLHHYDEIGLFSPSGSTASGHRLYSEEDVVKLQQIISLRQLGFALEDVKAFLHDPDYDPLQLLELQLDRLNAQIRAQQELRSRLEQLQEMLRTERTVSPEHALETIQLMNMSQSPHFRPEQVAELKMRYQNMGAAESERMREQGRKLIDRFSAAMRDGTSPGDEAVQLLARQWQDLLRQFTDDEEQLTRSAERYYGEHPEQARPFGMDGELYAYIRAALDAQRSI